MPNLSFLQSLEVFQNLWWSCQRLFGVESNFSVSFRPRSKLNNNCLKCTAQSPVPEFGAPRVRFIECLEELVRALVFMISSPSQIYVQLPHLITND